MEFKNADKTASTMPVYVFKDNSITYDLIKKCLPTDCQSNEKLEMDGKCSKCPAYTRA